MSGIKGNQPEVMVSSIRQTEFFMKGRCPYIKYFMALCKDLMIHLKESEEIKDYFDWSDELIEIEKNCMTLFLENIFTNFKRNKGYSIEQVMYQEYFDGTSYRNLQREFDVQISNGKETTEDEQPVSNAGNLGQALIFIISVKRVGLDDLN